MKNSTEILDTFIRVLNEAHAADRYVIQRLVETRFPCNDKLADHPTIQVTVQKAFIETYDVGLLGIINGICEPLTGMRVAAEFSDPDIETGEIKLLGFSKYDPKK